jgi:methyl-accepting chemotaxis protein
MKFSYKIFLIPAVTIIILITTLSVPYILHSKLQPNSITAQQNDFFHKILLFSTFIIITGIAAIISLSFFVVRSIKKSLNTITSVAHKVAEGDLNQDINYRSQDEIGQFAESLREIIQFQKLKVEVAEHIAQGELATEIFVLSEEDVLSKAMHVMRDSIKALIEDIDMLAQAAINGDLSVRADATKHQGDFRKIVEGVNNIFNAIVNPINDATDVLQRVALRDMTIRVLAEYHGDYEKIKTSLNSAVENLDVQLQQVAISANQVATAAQQIGSGSQAIARGAAEQAGALESVTQSLHEIANIVTENTHQAKEANHISERAKYTAHEGVESMKQLSQAMEKIKTSSDETAKIVKTIHEIAFQTNLLALNAAVEAARAGDSGRGFAVVAQEVRNLAVRSAQAAKNTAKMIKESIVNVDHGFSVNQKVLSKLSEIHEKITNVSHFMSLIATKSEQQSQRIELVNQNVERMNLVTQQNAANSEESASVAEELSGQANEMRSMVMNFKLSSNKDVSINVVDDEQTGQLINQLLMDDAQESQF